VSLRVLGFAYEHAARPVAGDFDCNSMLTVNPLGRAPSLAPDGGEVPIDSGAIPRSTRCRGAWRRCPSFGRSLRRNTPFSRAREGRRAAPA
jgi:hypothetical protein